MFHTTYMPIEALHRVWCYYRERVPAIEAEPGRIGRWQGDCPLCDQGSLEVDGFTGAWRCCNCAHDGDIYAFEMAVAGCALDEAILQVEAAYMAQLGLTPDEIPVTA